MVKFPIQLLDLLFLMYVPHHGPLTFLWQRTTSVTVGWFVGHLNYCVIFMIYSQFKNVTVSYIIQSGGLQVGDPYASHLWIVSPLTT
jgi:hypothetical protein